MTEIPERTGLDYMKDLVEVWCAVDKCRHVCALFVINTRENEKRSLHADAMRNMVENLQSKGNLW